MCGIAGFINHPSKVTDSRMIIKKMVNALRHRGPNSSGVWFDESKNLFLGHARLSIIDLTSAGHQPMESFNGRYVISFNGEIYNHNFLRQQVLKENHAYKYFGNSDTESFLSYLETFGIRLALEDAQGMFAIAIWDKKNNELTLARDKVGEKPLYFGFQNGTFLFASELTALDFHPDFKKETNHESIDKFLRLSYVPQPLSIYKDINKLKQGCYVTLTSNDFKSSHVPKIKKYWDYKSILLKNNGKLIDISFSEAVKCFEQKLELSVNQMMLSDVPIGSFLSGGIDSSLITSLMQKNSLNKIKTFSIGFNESDFNEAQYAKQIANHLKTDHHEMILDSSYVLDNIANIQQYYDEPFGDSSALPTYLLTKFAKDKIGVAISGDGCDELFGGYNRYHRHRILRSIQLIPYAIRKKLFNFFNYNYRSFVNFLSYFVNEPQLNIRYLKGIKVLDCHDIEQLYQSLISAWETNFDLTKSKNQSYTGSLNPIDNDLEHLSSEEKMMYGDFIEYLPDDILVKVDRASMQNSLEVRVPYINSDLIEYSCSLPLKYKISGSKGKLLPRKLLSNFIPVNLFERPKQGFAIPLEPWLKGPLKEWASDLISSKDLDTYLDDQVIRNVWNDFLLNKNNEASGIWNILMLKSWIKR